MKYGPGRPNSPLTGRLSATGPAQVLPQKGVATRSILACLPLMTCMQLMKGGQAGMTLLTCVISCLSDQQVIMTWLEGVAEGMLTATPITKQGRVGVTFYPGGNGNIVRHVMLMVRQIL